MDLIATFCLVSLLSTFFSGLVVFVLVSFWTSFVAGAFTSLEAFLEVEAFRIGVLLTFETFSLGFSVIIV